MLSKSQDIKDLASKIREQLAKGVAPKEAFGMSEELLEHLYEMGYGHFSTGEYEKALSFFDYLLGMDSSSYKYAMGWAASHHHLGHYNDALVGYGYAQTLDLTDPLPSYFIADCLNEIGEKEGALEVLEFFVKACKNNQDYREYCEKAKAMASLLKNS